MHVRGHRQAQPGGDAGQELVAALAAGADHGRRPRAVDELGDRRRPAVGMIEASARRARRRCAVVTPAPASEPAAAARGARVRDEHRLERRRRCRPRAARARPSASSDARSGSPPAMLDEGEDGPLIASSTPIRVSRSTTAGAASGPRPSTSAAVVSSSAGAGTIFSSPPGLPRRASSRSISFFFARSRPGTDG